MEKESHCGYPEDFLQKKHIDVFGSPFPVYFCPACRRYVYSAEKNGILRSRIEDIELEVVGRFIENVILENEEKQPRARKTVLAGEAYPLQIR